MITASLPSRRSLIALLLACHRGFKIHGQANERGVDKRLGKVAEHLSAYGLCFFGEEPKVTDAVEYSREDPLRLLQFLTHQRTRVHHRERAVCQHKLGRGALGNPEAGGVAIELGV